MKILPTGIAQRIENIQGVIRLNRPGRGQMTVPKLKTVLEIHAAGVVQVPGNREAVRFRPVTPVVQGAAARKISPTRDVAGQSQRSGIRQSSIKVRVADGQIA